MLDRLAQLLLRPLELTGRVLPEAPAETRLRLSFLGTAGFTLAFEGDKTTTVVIDPYLSRPSLGQCLLRPLEPDPLAVAKFVPQADAVLVGHSHFDHVLDAPEVCRQTGALLFGSKATMHIGRAAGLPEHQLRETFGGEDYLCEGVRLRALPSVHGRVYFGRIPLPGDLDAPPPWPPRLRELPHGQVFNWEVEGQGLTVVHIDSADFIDEALLGRRADVLCLCAIGRVHRPNYTARAIELLRPKYVVPCHYDYFFGPLGEPTRLLPGVALEDFLDEIRAAGSTPVLLAPLESFSL